MKKKLLATLLCLCMTATLLCSCGQSYDYSANDLTPYVTLPSDALTHDYAADVTLKTAPTDQDVEDKINETIKEFGEGTELTEGTVEDGDTLIMDFTGKIDGETFEGGSATDTEHIVSVDESTFIEGFDVGLIGMAIGETKDLNLAFPDPYENNPDLSGKPVVFTVTVKKITRVVPPILTEELMAAHADTFGDDTTPDAYRNTVRKNLLEENENENLTSLKKAVWNYVYNNSTFSGYPEGVLEAQMDALENYYEHTVAAGQNQHMKEYVKKEGYESVSQFREEKIRPEAEKDVKKRLVLYAFAKMAEVSMTDKEAKEAALENYNENIKPMLSIYAQVGVTDFNSYLDYIGGLSSVKESKLYSNTLDKIAKSVPGAVLSED